MTRRGLLVCVLLVLACGPGWAARGAQGGGGQGGGGQRGGAPGKGMVAADHPVAAAAGAEILRAGGNAVDAAVATSFALAVVRPESCGLGGGGFMVISLPEGAPRGPRNSGAAKPAVQTFLNYRETAPGGVGLAFFERRGPEASVRGATAAGVPGTVAGLLEALETYGTLDRAAVMAPAIRAAREGFAADAAYASVARKTIESFEKNPEFKTRFEFLWRTYLLDGRLREGDLVRNPEQAAALELIAKEGAGVFYRGAIAAAIDAVSRRDGGALQERDLRTYKVVESAPLAFEFLGRRVLTAPPPSAGGMGLGQVLGILEIRKIQETAKADPAQYVHQVAEAFKAAFADRAEHAGDPGGNAKVPLERLLSAAYLQRRAKLISEKEAGDAETFASTPGRPRPKGGGTSHASVVDGWGGAVAVTETINLEFGSWLAVDGYGFLLNNEMDDFTTRRAQPNALGLVQGERNTPAPGRRPVSSMTPTIVLDRAGHVEVVAGGSGGPRIVTATAQAILNVLVRGMNAGEAVATPRIHHQLNPNVLELEKGFDVKMPSGAGSFGRWAESLGHVVRPMERGAAVQLITRNTSGLSWDGAADPRKGGAAVAE